MSKDDPYFNNAMFIVGSGKSGTTLLQALFDNHPNLVVFPVESQYYHQYPPLVNSSKVANIKEEFLKFWIQKSKFSWMAKSVYTEHPLEVKRDFTAVKFDVFRNVLNSYDFDQHTRVRFYKTLVDAYRQSIGQPMENIVRFVDKSPIHMFYIETIRQDFSDAKFIHILRNPFDNYHAFCSRDFALNFKKDTKDLLGKYVEQHIAQSFIIATYHSGNRNYRVLRYEDLVYQPEETMRTLADWIGIPYHNILLSITLCGKPWSGNSSAKERFKGISTNRIGHGDRISDEEKEYIYKRLGNLAKRFGY